MGKENRRFDQLGRVVLSAVAVGTPMSPAFVRSVQQLNLPPRPEIGYEKQTVRQLISALWLGEITPTWIEISGCCGGQVQVRRWDEASNDWEEEIDPAFTWIHISKDKPLGFKGIFFIHRSELERSTGIKSGTTLKIYAGWDHDHPVLVARVGVSAVYNEERFNDADDPLVRRVASSKITLAIVTCDPPGCQESCPQRKVYYAWASLP